MTRMLDWTYLNLIWLMCGLALLIVLSGEVGCGDGSAAWAASCVSTCDQYGCVTICL